MSVRNNRSKGFTLVELLVVIATLSVLIALLLPALAKAKARAGGVKCLSNNMQMMRAWKMYTDDSKDILLFASEDPSDPRTRAAAWVTGTMDFTPENRSNWDVEEDIKKSPLWRYHEAADIWRCPADSSGVVVDGRFRPRVRTLSMSLWVGGAGGFVWEINGTGFRVYRKLGDFSDPGPESTWLFMDQREDSINMGNFGTSMHGWPDNPKLYRFISDWPASYHHRAAGIAFVDGHAEIHRWLDSRTMPPIVKNSSALNELGVHASENNPDIRWLQERTTRKH